MNTDWWACISCFRNLLKAKTQTTRWSGRRPADEPAADSSLRNSQDLWIGVSRGLLVTS